MNVDIDSLIETAEEWLSELEDSGEVWKGLVLICAIKLFKEQREKKRKAAKNEQLGASRGRA